MKIALVHELLTMRGGAERVARIFAEMFPEAPIYTLLYNEAVMGEWLPKARVRTSTLQKRAERLAPVLGRRAFNHHLYLRKFPAAVEAWDFSEFDLVLSSSSAFAHGIITNGAPKHLSYIHSPARYLWDRTHDVLEEAGAGILGPLKRVYLERTFHRLRTWDAEVAPRADKLIAASAEVQRRIELYWRRPSALVHPPIDDFWFADNSSSGPREREHPGYFLVVSTLARYKRIDLAIAACNQLGMHLKIVGDGPDRARLERLAGPTIEFYGYRQGDELRDLYTDAKAVLFPGAEDFGLVPVEAMACGTPVIAYRGGGALETVVEGETGLFFDHPNAESLAGILGQFDRSAFDADACRARASIHTRAQFEKKILECIEKMH